AHEAIPAPSLPLSQVEDTDGNFSVALPLGEFVSGVPSEKWIQASIPLHAFASGSIHPFNPRRIRSVHFGQSVADATPRTLVIDEVKIDDAGTAAPANASIAMASNDQTTVPIPQDVRAKGYDRHIDITWGSIASDDLQRNVMYRYRNGNRLQPNHVSISYGVLYSLFVEHPKERTFQVAEF